MPQKDSDVKIARANGYIRKMIKSASSPFMAHECFRSTKMLIITVGKNRSTFSASENNKKLYLIFNLLEAS